MARQILENIQLQGTLDWFNVQTQVRKEVQECVKPVLAELKDIRGVSYEKYSELADVHARLAELEFVAGVRDNALTGAQSKFAKLEDALLQSNVQLKGEISDFDHRVVSCQNEVASVREAFEALTAKHDLLERHIGRTDDNLAALEESHKVALGRIREVIAQHREEHLEAGLARDAKVQQAHTEIQRFDMWRATQVQPHFDKLEEFIVTFTKARTETEEALWKLD